MKLLLPVLKETATITFLVLIMLMVMDLAYIYTRGKIQSFLLSHKALQFVIAAGLGAIPGCEGAFLAVSLYAHGMIGMGALLGAFIATSGDEAFVMLSLFPLTALKLFGMLFLCGVVFGWLADLLIKKSGWKNEEWCETEMFHPHSTLSLRHYFFEHFWDHLIKKHLVRIAVWTFSVLLVIAWGNSRFDLIHITRQYPLLTIGSAGLIGLIPVSGPHLIFVNMFAAGSIPFSVLFTNMFIQSGHALLPMLSFSLKDSFALKLMALVIGLPLGILIFFLGM